jgi:glycosyltransferase involved in cell wall biosynthesis
MTEFLSAALIVRDEERYLDGCLASIRNLVDEIVVVDTGSVDRSREIAAAHGARLSSHVWRNDFAVARNQALDLARGDWILYIDADERVRAYDRDALKQELVSPGICAATVRFHAKTGFTAYPEYRLFRRDPRIRFESAIHETIMPSLGRIVEAGEGYCGSSQLTIDHLGYDGDQSHKHVRNLALLQKQVEADPDRHYLWWHLGTVYRDTGRLAEAEAAWREGVTLARASLIRRAEEALCFIELAKLQLARGEDALPLIAEAEALQPDNWLLCWLRGQALIMGEHYEEAMPVFERLSTIDADRLISQIAYDKRLFGAWALAELGRCAFRAGRYRESERWYLRAEAMEPSCLEFRVKRQLAGSRAGRSG